MPDMITGTFYLVVGKKRGYQYQLGPPKIYVQKPTIPKGTIALRLELELPKKLFEEFIPSGRITLPEDASIGRPAIEVRVPDDLTVTPDIQLALVEWPADDPSTTEGGET